VSVKRMGARSAENNQGERRVLKRPAPWVRGRCGHKGGETSRTDVAWNKERSRYEDMYCQGKKRDQVSEWDGSTQVSLKRTQRVRY